MGGKDLDGCAKFMKYALFIVNFLIFVLGVAVLGFGIWVLTDKAGKIQNITGSDYYVPSAAILLTFGGIVAFISFLGCCGAIKEVKCLLGTFCVIMLLITILIVIGAIFGFMVSGKVGDAVNKAMKETMTQYGGDKPEGKVMKESWDEIQKELKCCGTDTWMDWQKQSELFSETAPIPNSCCKPEEPTCDKPFHPDKPDAHYAEGCYKILLDKLQGNSKTMAAIGISIVVFIVLSMIFSCALCLQV